jgi:hypothetical protein
MKNSDKIILDLCGGTGSWSKPYKDAGYDVRLVTIPDNDVRTYQPPENVYGILAAPPCTMFSFARTNAVKPRSLEEGMEIVIACLNIIWNFQYKLINQYSQKPTLKFWALENPNGHLKYFLGKPAFIFDPYEFGDIYSKKTHLWGWFNEPIKTHKSETRTLRKKFDMLSMQEIRSISDNVWKNTKTRQELRGITPAGFAKAFFESNL